MDARDIVATLELLPNHSLMTYEVEFVAIRDLKSGDAAQMVYATDQGSYYHSKPDCSGMIGSKAISIEDVLVAGKTAWPTCIGGHNSCVSTADYIVVSDQWPSDNWMTLPIQKS